MPEFCVGPILLGAYTTYDSESSRNSNWTELVAGIVTGRHDDGTLLETALKGGFKSDHAIQMFGEDDPNDSIVIDGVTYYGKTVPGPEKDKPYRLTALQVGARAAHLKRMQEAKKASKVINITDARSNQEPDSDAQTA